MSAELRENDSRSTPPPGVAAGEPLRILIVEDVPSDAELEERALAKGGIRFVARRVETRDEFIRALGVFAPDLILSDFSLPDFDGMAALRIAKEKAPHIPFIIMTGSINEETAVECIKAGADDYLLKDRLARLVPSVQSALAKRRTLAEKALAEAALRESEERFRTLVEEAGDAFVVHDLEGRFLDVNELACRSLGYSRDELLTMNFQDVEKDFTLEQAKEAWRHMQPRAPATVCGHHRRKDGTLFPVEARVVSLDHGGRRVVLGLVRDITERVKAEQALRESEERFRSLVEGAPDAVFVGTGKGMSFAYANPSAMRLFGASKSEELLSHSILERIHPDFRAEVLAHVRLVDEEDRRIPPTEGRFLRLDGTEVEVEVSVMPITYEGERGGLVFARDITERKRAERLEHALYEIARIPEMARSLDDLYQLVHQIIAGLMPAENFFVAMYDEKENVLSLPYFVDEVDVPSPPHKLGKGLTAYVVRTGSALLCDAARSQELIRTGEAELVGVPSACWLGVPLRIGDKTIGALVLQHYSDAKAYGEREMQVLDYVAAQVASAIERRQAQQALQDSEERFRLLFERNVAGVFRSRMGGGILECNQAFASMFGFDSPEELLKQPVETLYSSSAKLAAFRKRLISERKLVNVETLMRRKDGQEFWVLENTALVEDDKGNPVVIEGTCLDITEHKGAEAALKKSEETAKALINAPLEAMALTETDGCVLALNRTMADRFGCSPSDLIGRRIHDFMPARLAARREQKETEVVDTGKPVQFIDERDGRVLDNSIYPVFDADGRVTSLAIYSRDVTDLRRAEAQRDLLAQAVEQSHDTVVLTDKEGTILYVNPAFTRITGYTKEEALGQNPRILKSGLHGQTFYEELWGTIRSGEAWSGRFIDKRKDGTLFDEQAVISPVHGPDGALTAFVATKRDVTQELALERKLAEAKKLETIGMVAGGVAHEVRNPLFAISAIVAAMEKKLAGSAEFGEYVAHVQDQVARLSRLMDDLLVLGRPIEPSQFVQCSLRDVLEDSMKMLRESHPDCRERCIVSLPPEALAIQAFAPKLSQVFTNLLQNALYFSAGGGKIRIRIFEAGGSACLSVSDEGPGIPADLLPAVFEPFKSRRKGGTGLGLAIAKKIVEAHGGSIEVANNTATPGATFTVRLPMEAEA